MKKKAIVNYFVDAGLALTFLLVAVTGVLKFPKLLQITGIAKRLVLRNTITFIHDWSGVAMSLLVIVHIVLHWRWIVVMSKKIFGKKR